MATNKAAAVSPDLQYAVVDVEEVVHHDDRPDVPGGEPVEVAVQGRGFGFVPVGKLQKRSV